MADFIRPSVKAFIVCDTVIKDEITSKMSAIGMFSTILAPQFPCQHAALSLYLCLTGGYGEYRFTVDLVFLDKDIIIGKGQFGKIDIPDPLKTTEIGMLLPGVIFPAPGKYEFRLYSDGNFIESRDFSVDLLQAHMGA